MEFGQFIISGQERLQAGPAGGWQSLHPSGWPVTPWCPCPDAQEKPHTRSCTPQAPLQHGADILFVVCTRSLRSVVHLQGILRFSSDENLVWFFAGGVGARRDEGIESPGTAHQERTLKGEYFSHFVPCHIRENQEAQVTKPKQTSGCKRQLALTAKDLRASSSEESCNAVACSQRSPTQDVQRCLVCKAEGCEKEPHTVARTVSLDHRMFSVSGKLADFILVWVR